MRFYKWIKSQFFHLLPALLFFYIAFNLINITEWMLVKKDGIEPFNFLTILIAAGIVAKVILIVDFLPVVNIFPKRPLIYNVMWKTLLYGIVSLLVRLLDRYLPFYFGNRGYQDFMESVDWSQFWGIQIWFFILFLIFTSAKDFIFAIGYAKSKEIFFGSEK